MNEWQQKGYDAWLEIWIDQGITPTASQCPARYLAQGSQERADYISGWNKAKEESRK